MKIGIGLALSILTYFATNKYVALCQFILTKNNVHQSVSVDQFWIYSLIFSLTAFLTLVVIIITSTNWKSLFLIFILNILVGFSLNILIIEYLSQYSIAPNISKEITPSYNVLFLVPTLFLTPILLVNLIRYTNNDRWLEKARLFKEINIDFRIKRFLGNISDIIVCLGIHFLFIKLGLFVEYLFSFAVTYFLYKYILEASTKTTVGKNLFNLTVKSSLNKGLKPRHFMLRNICRIIPFYTLPVLLNKPAFHDLISGTRVVELNSV